MDGQCAGRKNGRTMCGKKTWVDTGQCGTKDKRGLDIVDQYTRDRDR